GEIVLGLLVAVLARHLDRIDTTKRRGGSVRPDVVIRTQRAEGIRRVDLRAGGIHREPGAAAGGAVVPRARAEDQPGPAPCSGSCGSRAAGSTGSWCFVPGPG